jgi:transcriptional regulator with XRE-family HTH domain
MSNPNSQSNIEQFVIEKVKEHRLKLSISQAELAFRIGVSPGFIGNVESRKFSDKYNLNHLNKFAEVFNCSPKDFLPETTI